MRGYKINVPKLQKVRPTSERVREAIFSKIYDQISEATFLDVCSGSGVMSLEALSRGASFAYLVEKHRKCIPIIRENFLKCKIPKEKFKVITGDAKKLPLQKSDIVFLDPPYIQSPDPWLISIEEKAAKMLIFEHSSKTELPNKTKHLRKFDEKKYGDTKISYFMPIET